MPAASVVRTTASVPYGLTAKAPKEGEAAVSDWVQGEPGVVEMALE